MSKNREFLMLSKNFDKDRDRIGGMYVSEKMDGERAIWIPAARGRLMKDISCFANIAKGGGTRGKGKSKGMGTHDIVSTGLFSRYGNCIDAPHWFTDLLPDFPVDGELWCPSGHQRLRSIVSKQDCSEHDTGWHNVDLLIFDAPTYNQLFEDGRISNPNFKKQIDRKECFKQLNIPNDHTEPYMGFEYRLRFLQKQIDNSKPYIKVHNQTLLEFNTKVATEQLNGMLEVVLAQGGEGLIVRHPGSEWEPIRSRFSLKVKDTEDAEGQVLGYTMGEGKFEGMIGSIRLLMLDQNGKSLGTTFDLSGFTDAERMIDNHLGTGKTVPGTFIDTVDLSSQFPMNSIITYKYRELTDGGIPKEARFKRLK